MATLPGSFRERPASGRGRPTQPRTSVANLPHPRAARPADFAAVRSLLEAADLPVADVDPQLAGFVVVVDGDRVVGVAGLERYSTYGLLRSVAVAGDWRGQGLGGALTRAIVDEARRLGLEGVYALTTTAADYFPRLGFEVIERTAVPVAVQASSEFSVVCPSSATVLALRLDGHPAPGSDRSVREPRA